VARYPFPRFLALLSVASLVQALLFLWLGAFIGDHVLPYLRHPYLRVALIVVVVLIGFLTHRALARRRVRAEKE
jgi:membrane protein DedA with SNARE-associated domain